jgi:hypothetical protein
MNQQQYSELDDLFSGSGAPVVKFTKVGDDVIGTISSIEVRQQRDFDTNEPKTWDDGKPMMEVILTLDTAERDRFIEDDDGSRRVFVRGAMLTALRQAVRKAKATKPEIGGRIAITHSGLGEAKKRGFNAPKLYDVEYEPADVVAVQEVFAEPVEQSSEDLLKKAAEMDPASLAALLAQIEAK